MDRPPQVAFSFSVNDADPVDIFVQAGIDVLRDETSQLVRLEGMEIQRTVYG